MSVTATSPPAAAPETTSAPGFMAALLTPLQGVFNPRAASARLQRASLAAVAVTVGIFSVGIAVVMASIIAVLFIFPDWLNDPRRDFVAFVWQRLHPTGPIGPFEVAILLTTVALAAAPLVLTLLFLPRLSAAGGLREGVGRGYAAGVTTLGSLVGLVALYALLVLGLEFCSVVLLNGPFWFWAYAGAAVLAPLLAWLQVWQTARAFCPTHAAADSHAPPVMCAGCGYDLSVLPPEPRCPECGLDIAQSITPIRRPGSQWQQRPRLKGWLEDAADLLFFPRRFYAALAVRGELAVLQRFAGWNYVVLGLVAWLWNIELLGFLDWRNDVRFFGNKLSDPEHWFWLNLTLFLPLPLLIASLGGVFALLSLGSWRRWRGHAGMAGGAGALTAIVLVFVSESAREFSENSVIPLAFGLFSPLVCWFGLRILGGLATAAAFWGRMLPDGRWAEKVVACESVFAWVFCTFWGAGVTSLSITNGHWLTDLLGQQFCYAVFGMPAENAVFFLGTGGLGLLALYRYRVAFRAIRWASF